MIPYRVVRTRRKTIAMQISPEGEVIVRCPLRCPSGYIAEFVEKHQSWAVKHAASVRAQNAQRREFRIADGDKIPFCGQTLTVSLWERDTLKMEPGEGRLWLPTVSVADLRPRLYQLYKQHGREFLTSRLSCWAEVMGVTYSTVRIGSAVKRWGSCSRDGSINLSWLLFFAPTEAIDYILVHELAHRREMNHSPRFWAIVGEYIPDYPHRKRLVNDTHSRLLAEGWAAK